MCKIYEKYLENFVTKIISHFYQIFVLDHDTDFDDELFFFMLDLYFSFQASFFFL